MAFGVVVKNYYVIFYKTHNWLKPNLKKIKKYYLKINSSKKGSFLCFTLLNELNEINGKQCEQI